MSKRLKQRRRLSQMPTGGEKDGDKDEVRIEFLLLDLCDLKGCVRAAREFMDREERLDILSK